MTCLCPLTSSRPRLKDAVASNAADRSRRRPSTCSDWVTVASGSGDDGKTGAARRISVRPAAKATWTSCPDSLLYPASLAAGAVPARTNEIQDHRDGGDDQYPFHGVDDSLRQETWRILAGANGRVHGGMVVRGRIELPT